MMKRILLGVALVLALTLNCVAQQKECQRHAETSAGFSVCPPEGWSVHNKEGQKYAIILGPRGSGFTPNINFKDEVNSAPLADYVAASLKTILTSYEKLGATSLKVVDQREFTTDSGMKGFRVSFSTVYKQLTIRTLQYYFNGKAGQKFIITGTALEADSETNDKLLDRAAKSFRLDG